jgi:hypothetical protein
MSDCDIKDKTVVHIRPVLWPVCRSATTEHPSIHPYKVGDSIVLSETLATSSLDPDWLPQSVSFKYLGVVLMLELDEELRLNMFRKNVYKDKFF